MPASGGDHRGRTIVVALVSLVAVLLVIRAAAVADRERSPHLASALWGSHPAVLTDKALLDVATAAAKGQPVPAATRSDLRRIAERAPLSPDPYLVEAAIAQTTGSSGAERLLLAARSRDPRSRGTRYLLADHYLRTGRVTAALVEIQVLVGLQARGADPFIPMLVGYAQTPGSVSNLKPLFRKYPNVEARVLTQLAGDVRNADLVLGLAGSRQRNPAWLGNLVAALVADGQYRKAHAIWRARSGLGGPEQGLFNSRFAKNDAPPPFNWNFPQTPEGVAEPNGKGGMDVLYYGRSDALLASQLLLLTSGSHELVHRVTGSSGAEGSLRWVVRCAKPDAMVADMPLKSGAVRFSFQIPAGCEAVWLELRGKYQDTPRTIGLTVIDLNLVAGRRQ